MWTRVSKAAPPPADAASRADPGGITVALRQLAYLASAEFGPIGIGWGYDLEEDVLREGAPIVVAGQVVGRELMHTARIRFWHRRSDHPQEKVEFTARAHAMFVSSTNAGPMTDPDAPARTELQAFAVCMSKIGFNVAGITAPAQQAATSVQTRLTPLAEAGGTSGGSLAVGSIPANERDILDNKVKGLAVVDDPENIRRAREMVSSILQHPLAIAEFQEKANQRIEEIERSSTRSAHF
ncbi:hypothetical protein [Paraburkholderia fungorum]|jgi:hypothetical protein|nr:hypothetical protein [Paraburkholderia fungorum]MBB4516389.1 hypothetical protein [Paraburkholderia fungorum]MBB5546701.1 hypothetical protein [Paraburkholderia fungorum]MBB6205139.1 hypothetical protein [Paraburkholderia fungorum]MBU7440741.1 hypothetical protein [Paraburkholderia fungorum]MDE1007349.1 hypothetical protein [Paraburkholderia fungorum]